MKPLFFTAFLLLFFHFLVQGQLKADFSVNKQGGCSPLLVQFTNTTTGASAAASYQWEFGNGNTSALKDPGAVYREEKTYTVTLTVKDGTQQSSKTGTITVYKKPEADFSVSIAKGCLPLPVTFTATATPGDGTIRSYDWDFGDGSTLQTTIAQAPHTFNQVQHAGASLTVTNSFGCFQTISKTKVVDVKEALTPDFAVNKRFLCRETDSVQLTNYSNGPGTLTYLWEFGDGKTSTNKNPVHSFQKKGSFTIKLTANSSDGCTATIAQTDFINVASFKSDFTVPEPVCQQANAVFTNISSPQPASWQWLVDGAPVYAYSDVLYYTFFNDGKHTVALKTTFGDCSDSVTKVLEVKAPPVLQGFVADIESPCGSPVKVTFRDTTTSAKAWRWYFDSYAAQSTVQAPSYTFQYDNAFYVQLEVTNDQGCKSSVGKQVYISRPLVNITSPDTYPNGEILSCGPKDIRFEATKSEPLTSYKWDFGDGGTSTDSTPVHYYGKAGIYYVKLNYTTASGCSGETKLYYPVGIHEMPKADFSLSQTTICGNTPVTVINNSKVPGNLPYFSYYYQWDLGNGYFSANTGQINSFVHRFQDSGVYNISLIVSDLVCADTITKKGYVKVLPPFPKIAGVENTCEGTRGRVTFNQTSKLFNSWTWDFGDGSSASPATNQQNVEHTYAKTGTYKVVLTTTNGQCTVKDSVFVPVLLKQNPVLTIDKTEVCSREDYVKVSISNLERNTHPVSNMYGYSYGGWYHRDGTFAPQNVSSGDMYQLPLTVNIGNFTPGKQDLQVVLYSYVFGCTDTTNWVPLKTKGPLVAFKTVAKPCAAGNIVYLQDQSQPQNGKALRSWEWNFGDGKTETYNNANEVSHVYFWPGMYYVTLKVTDADGCYNYSYGYVYTENNSLKASFTASATVVSPGTTVQFTNTSVSSEPDHTTYKWLLGDGTTAITTDVSRLYAQPGVYTVKLIAINALRGCADTASAQITVKYVNAAFTYNSRYLTESKCPPVMVQFTNTSANISRILWDFGDGTTSSAFSPNHIYTKAGKYYVSVKTFSDNGTVYTTVDSVLINAPLTGITADKTVGCAQQNVKFESNATDAAQYWWDFGDGQIKQTAGAITSHLYTGAGSYTPGLIVADADGCTASAVLSSPMLIDSLAVTIKKLPSNICTPKEIFFEPEVSGHAAQTVLRYHWNYGTGNVADTSNLQKPSFAFTKPGTYTVRLTVSSNTGCSKQTSEMLTAFEGLGGVINGPAEICEGSSAAFTGATLLPGRAQWQWIFHDGTTVNTQNAAPKRYDVPGTYPVKLVVNNNGCADTVSKTLNVNPKPRNILATHEAIVCEGASLTIAAGGGSSYQWSPAAGLNTTSGATVLASPVADVLYRVVATTGKGCSNSDSIKISVVHPFTLSLLQQATICQGNSVELKASGAALYHWTGNTATLNSTTVPNPVARPQVTTVYTVVGRDQQGCFTDTASIHVVVNSLPVVNAGPDVDVLAGTPVQLNTTASSDVVSWRWSPADFLSCTNCPSPEAKPLRPMTYNLIVQTAEGCEAKDSVTVHLLCSGSRIFVPNTFTPNNDGKNDLFRIKAEGIKMVRSFRIFNRWGEVVFERTNFSLDNSNAAWNGKYKGQPVSAGTYVYQAELTCNDQVFQQKGTITVVY
jgi:gliding motility-associated-like protein